jgi:hypothetical protein
MYFIISSFICIGSNAFQDLIDCAYLLLRGITLALALILMSSSSWIHSRSS